MPCRGAHAVRPSHRRRRAISPAVRGGAGRMKRIRVLALASYPVEAASSRYRIVQFIEPLARRGIDVTFAPFLDASLFAALYTPGKLLRSLPRIAARTMARAGALARASRADVVFVQ